MSNLITNVFARIRSVLNMLQVKQVLAIVLVGFIVLSTGTRAEQRTKAITNRIDNVVHQDDSDRPKLTGEWQKEAREVEGEPGERIKRIAEESVEAVKDFGQLYPDTAERTIPAIGD